MKKIITILLIISPVIIFAQDKKVVQKPANNLAIAPMHRIVFQVATNDTMAHKQLMKQLGNIMSIAPGTQLEVVCHGPGLDMLVADKSVVADKIKTLRQNGVVFNACEFTMKDRKIEKEQMLSDASYVPAAILEIATRQEQGWSYIKSGF